MQMGSVDRVRACHVRRRRDGARVVASVGVGESMSSDALEGDGGLVLS